MSSNDPGSASPDAALTRDPILRGRLVLWQPVKGYRFSVDALVLARHVADHLPPEASRLADLGAGCGVVGLAVARAAEALAVSLVEIQPRLAGLCRRNIVENGLGDRAAVIEGDLRDPMLLMAGAFDAVASNPPYRPAGSGRPSPDPERAAATTELRVTLSEVIRAAARLLVPGGSATFIYPAERLGELLAEMSGAGLGPRCLRPVHPLPGAPARRVLVEGAKDRRDRLEVCPPLVIHSEPGVYTEEASRILGETSAAPAG